jgi:hypothetical protein
MTRQHLADAIAARLLKAGSGQFGATAASIASAEIARAFARLATNTTEPRNVVPVIGNELLATAIDTVGYVLTDAWADALATDPELLAKPAPGAGTEANIA